MSTCHKKNVKYVYIAHIYKPSQTIKSGSQIYIYIYILKAPVTTKAKNHSGLKLFAYILILVDKKSNYMYTYAADNLADDILDDSCKRFKG